jgi:peptide deformylase
VSPATATHPHHFGNVGTGCKPCRIDPAARHRYMARMSSTIIPATDAETIPILIAPNAVLKAKARAVGPEDADLVRELVPRMFTTMYKAPGIGLAAPQVGYKLRLAVVDLMPGDKPAPLVLINPSIIMASTELATREEGCLSLPDQYADVTRPARVKVRYFDQQGARQEIEADGLLGACIQHELDHLDGILFVDHLSALKRNMLMRRLAKDMRLKDK